MEATKIDGLASRLKRPSGHDVRFYLDDLIMGSIDNKEVQPPPYANGETFRVTLFNAYFFRTPLDLKRYKESEKNIHRLLKTKAALFLPLGHRLVALENIPQESSGGLVEDANFKTGYVVLTRSYEKFYPE